MALALRNHLLLRTGLAHEFDHALSLWPLHKEALRRRSRHFNYVESGVRNPWHLLQLAGCSPSHWPGFCSRARSIDGNDVQDRRIGPHFQHQLAIPLQDADLLAASDPLSCAAASGRNTNIAIGMVPTGTGSNSRHIKHCISDSNNHGPRRPFSPRRCNNCSYGYAGPRWRRRGWRGGHSCICSLCHHVGDRRCRKCWSDGVNNTCTASIRTAAFLHAQTEAAPAVLPAARRNKRRPTTSM